MDWPFQRQEVITITRNLQETLNDSRRPELRKI